MPNNLSTLGALEQFVSLGAATVTAGGLTTPAAGTVETWTFSGSSLPPASNAWLNGMPPFGFYVADPAQPTEVIAVTNISGATATVVRGADGTVPVSHTANPFTVVQVPAGNTFGALYPFWQPAHNQLLDANMPIDIVSSTNLLTAGVVYLAKIIPRFSYLASTVWVFQSASPVGASTGTFVGLYSATGTRLTGSADQGANLVANTVASCPLTTPQQITAGVPYFVALLCNLATTQSTLRESAGGSTATPNVNLSNANSRGAQFGSGLTALPASITMASLTQGPVYLFGIS